MLLLILVFAVAPADPVQATSLQELISSGESLISGDGSLTFSNFQARARGPRAVRDLSLYDVSAIFDGIVVMSSAVRRARLILSYDVATSGTSIEGADMAVAGVERPRAGGRATLRNGRRPFARLRVTQRAGRDMDSAIFDGVTEMLVGDKLRFIRGGASDAITHTFSVTAPEPGTALLLASGLGTLGVLGRRRRR
jgi:hypothetical protein